MSLGFLSFHLRIILGFGIILFLFISGLSVGIVGINEVSVALDISNEASQLVEEILQARGHEKDFLANKNPKSVTELNQNISNLRRILTEISSNKRDKSFISILAQIKGLIDKYHTNFKLCVQHINEIDHTRSQMDTASGIIITTIEKQIIAPILDAQNMSLITGDTVNPAFTEILNMINPLAMDIKDAKLYENAFAISKNSEYFDKFSNKIKKWASIKDDLEYLINIAKNDELTNAKNEIEKQFAVYNSKTFENIVSFSKSNDKINKNMQKNGQSICIIIQELKQNAQIKTMQAKNLIFKLIAAILLFGIVLGVSLSYIITKSITNPLKKVINRVRDIAEGEGNLTVRLDIKSKDEIGELGIWFDTFMDKLQSMIKRISKNAKSLDLSAEDLINLSSVMSKSTDNVYNLSSTVVSATEKMNSTINSVSTTMTSTETNTNTVVTSTDVMVTAINEIAQNSEKALNTSSQAVSQAQETADRIEELGKSANDIGKITETITDISEQTNLLALNATIEAARAGEYGKGFAVVANEIKDLAMQTSTATHEIKDKVGGIQNTIGSTIKEIKQALTIINTLNDIVIIIASKAEDQSKTTSKIAENVSDTSQNILKVNKNITQTQEMSTNIVKEISDVNLEMQQMGGSCENVNKNALELNNLSQQLEKLVGEFVI